jgi:hypothetical protein
MRITELIQPKTPDQQRVSMLQATKDRASTALKNERDRQKRAKAVKALSNLSNLATRKPMGTT